MLADPDATIAIGDDVAHASDDSHESENAEGHERDHRAISDNSRFGEVDVIGTRSNGKVMLTIGPMSSAKARVPIPTVPPSNQPAASTVTSMLVRTIQIFHPQR